MMTYMMSDIRGKAIRFHSAIKRINLKPEDILFIFYSKENVPKEAEKFEW